MQGQNGRVSYGRTPVFPDDDSLCVKYGDTQNGEFKMQIVSPDPHTEYAWMMSPAQD